MVATAVCRDPRRFSNLVSDPKRGPAAARPLKAIVKWPGSGGAAAGPGEHAVERQKDQRADDGHDDRAEIEAGDAAAAEQAEYEPADEGARNANQHRHDDATRVTARHDQLGEAARDQSQNDPPDDTHGHNLLFQALGDVLLPEFGADPAAIEWPVVVRDVGCADNLRPVPV